MESVKLVRDIRVVSDRMLAIQRGIDQDLKVIAEQRKRLEERMVRLGVYPVRRYH